MSLAMIRSKYIRPFNILIPTIKITLKNIYTNIEIIITRTTMMIKNMFLCYKNKRYFNKPTILHKYDPTKYIFNKHNYDIIEKHTQIIYNYDKQTYLILFILLCFYIIYNINRKLLIKRSNLL